MAGDLALFISKRLQRPAAALLCLMVAQLLLAIVSTPTDLAPTTVRVAIGR